MPNSIINLKALREFSRYLVGTWEKEIILIELVKIFDEFIKCPRVSAYLFENGNFELKAKIGEPLLLDSPQILSEGHKLIPVFSCQDISCEPLLLNERDLYSIPLMCHEEVYGLVLFEISQLPLGMSDMISVLSTQAAVALKNISLAEEKKTIDKIVNNFASGLDMHIYYPQFAQELRQVVHFDLLTITIPNPFQGDELIVYDHDRSQLHTRYVAYEGSAPALVISTGNTVIEDDLTESRSFHEDDMLLDRGIRCALRVPLTSKGRVIGTLNIGSRLPGLYKQKEINLFTEIAKRIGPAVENALVYEIVNEKLLQALAQLEENFSATLNALTILLDKRDVGTKGHSVRVVRYATAVAEKLGVRGRELEEIRLGSLLHDIGKIGIPDSILFKPGKLEEHEWKVMKTHPVLGADMVSKIEFLAPAIPIVLHHHEWYNGGGYPDGLAGENIPLGARIFSVADAFDAMTSDRPYRKALSVDCALEALQECRYTQFCPMCVEAFMKIPLDKLKTIYDQCQAEVTFKSYYFIGQEYINAQTARDITRRR